MTTITEKHISLWFDETSNPGIGNWIVSVDVDETTYTVATFDADHYSVAREAAITHAKARSIPAVELEDDNSQTILWTRIACPACGETKDEEDFVDSSTHNTGGETICRDCHCAILAADLDLECKGCRR